MVAAPDSHSLFRPSFNDVQDERNKSCPAARIAGNSFPFILNIVEGWAERNCRRFANPLPSNSISANSLPALAETRPSNQNGG